MTASHSLARAMALTIPSSRSIRGDAPIRKHPNALKLAERITRKQSLRVSVDRSVIHILNPSLTLGVGLVEIAPLHDHPVLAALLQLDLSSLFNGTVPQEQLARGLWHEVGDYKLVVQKKRRLATSKRARESYGQNESKLAPE